MLDSRALDDHAALLGLPQPIVFLPETGSTNADLKDLAAVGGQHGAAFVADHQSQGRGRLQRTWLSPRGAGIALSVLLRPAPPLDRVGLLPLAAGVAVAEVCGPSYLLKWPNDVLSPDGRKVSGLLVEADLEEGWVVVGVGLNVHAAPALLQAACLEEVDGQPRDRSELTARLVWSLLCQARVLARRPEAILEAWTSRSHTLGREVVVGEVRGVAEEVDATGALLVRTPSGLRRVLAGDVLAVPPERE